MDGVVFRKDGIEFQLNDFEFDFDVNGNLIARHTGTGNELVFTTDGEVSADSVDASTKVTSPSVIANALEATDSITDASGDTHAGALADKDGDDLTPNTIDVATSITDPEGNTVTNLSDPVRVTEEASTFAESDVTVTHNNTKVNNESIEIVDIGTGSQLDLGSDDGTESNQSPGLEINPNTTLKGLDGKLSPNTASFDNETIEIRDSPNGTSLGSDRISGDTFSITGVTLNSGTDYYLEISHQTVADLGTNTSPSFPFSNSELDVTGSAAFEGGTYDTDTRYGYTHVTGTIVPTSADALVEWDSAVPDPIESYDLATFGRTLDDETVTIDVEDGNGNVLFSDIGQNFDISTADTSKEVKLRANLSRNDTANNPTCDYLARRFTR